MKERLDVEYRKKILDYVKKHDEAGNILKVPRYHVPDAASKNLPEEYIEEPDLPGGDGRRWEEERLMSAVFHTGAKNAKVIYSDNIITLRQKIQKEQDLELLLEDEHIDFVEAVQHLEGTHEKDVCLYYL